MDKNMEELFDKCVKDAVKLGRKHMVNPESGDKLMKEEWYLALVLFGKRLEE